MPTVNLKYKGHFDAAHFLQGYQGKCANLHGYRWDVEVEVSGPTEPDGMVIDFTIIKAILADLLPDHLCLNDLPDFQLIRPTAENLSAWLFDQIKAVLPTGVVLEQVCIWESPDACAIFKKGGRP